MFQKHIFLFLFLFVLSISASNEENSECFPPKLSCILKEVFVNFTYDLWIDESMNSNRGLAILDELTDQTVHEGSTANFSCGTTNPFSEVTWFYVNKSDIESANAEDFQPIYIPTQYIPSDRYVIDIPEASYLLDDPNTNNKFLNINDKLLRPLHIINATASDNGYYVCIVGFGGSTRYTYAYLNVVPKSTESKPTCKYYKSINYYYLFYVTLTLLIILTFIFLITLTIHCRNAKNNCYFIITEI